MRRSIRYVARAAIAALAITTGMVVLPGAARAADWDQTIQGVVRADRLFAHPDGKVTVAACGAPSGDSLQAKTFDTTGSTSYVNEVANGTSPKLYACVGQSAIGKDGTLYASGYYSGQSYERLVAYKDNQQKWNVQLPNSCSTFHSIAMGVNGNVYVVGGSCSGSTYRLIGFTPEVATGTSTPSVVLNVAVSNYFFGNTGDLLAAHDDGLVVQLNNGLQFFDYAGNTAGAVQPTDFAKGHDGAIVTNTNGRTFYPVTANTNQQSFCSSSGGYIHSSVVGQSPGGTDWLYTFSECEHVWFVRPTYDGGAIIDTWRHDEVTTPLGRWLTAVDGYGDVKWSIQVAQYNGTWTMSPHSITTTLNGDVLLASVLNERQNNPVNDNRVALNLYSGATGQNIGHKLFEGTTHGYSFAGPDDLVALTDGRVYTALIECNYTSCGSNRKLYAVDMAAVTPSYPRGAVLANDEPWLDYVALGDSFSSGEGVPDFTPPSDTNGCHRSNQAYSKVLDDNPNLRWNLTAFVACSGATTTAVISGKNGEPSQLTALSASTDVVTITIGGNDIEFVEFATECIGWPQYDPLRVCDAGNPQYIETIDKIDNVLPDNLTRTTVGNEGVLRRIRQAALNAKVYVIGYPQLAPPSNEPHQWPSCSWLNSESEHTAAREVVSRLNLRLRQAVTTMGTGFSFIDPNDPESPFLGHELCDGETYFNGPQLPQEYSLHPNSKGQSAYAQLVIANS